MQARPVSAVLGGRYGAFVDWDDPVMRWGLPLAGEVDVVEGDLVVTLAGVGSFRRVGPRS